MREIQLKATERQALLARRSAHADHVRRARIILLSADGVSGREIAAISKLLRTNGLKPHLVRTYQGQSRPAS